jgi:hypothetical protein
MALTILNRGIQNSIPSLSESCYTKANFGVNTNTTLSVNTPLGVLGGSVAGISAVGGDYVVVPCTDVDAPVGLFMNDAAGAAFENAPAIASGKVAVIKAMASVEVDVWETRNAADTANLTYAVGEKLYCSANGFLTKEVSTDGTVIGVVTKAPITASPTLGLEMRI